MQKLSCLAGSEDEARLSCLLFTLIECGKIHDMNTEDHLWCILGRSVILYITAYNVHSVYQYTKYSNI